MKTAKYWAISIGALVMLSVLTPLARAQKTDAIDPDPQHVALLWHVLSGTQPNIDAFVRLSSAYRSAQEIDRERVYSDMTAKINADLQSLAPQKDTYVIRIGSAMSAYDPRAGGFFLPLFSGASYVPIQNDRYGRNTNRKGFAQNILTGDYQLHFINPDEYVFWPMAEAEARAFMSKVGSRPNITARFEFRPIAAPAIPYVDQSPRRIYGHVTKVDLLDRRNSILKTRVTDLPEAAVRDQVASVRFKPSPDSLAMAWHKIVGGPQFNADALFRGIRNNDKYTKEDAAAYLQRYMDELDPAQPFTMLVAAEFSGYDVAAGEFPLTIDEPITYKSGFPGIEYRDDAEREAKRTAGKRKPAFRLPEETIFTQFDVDYANEQEIGGLKTDAQGAARLRPDPSRSYKAQAQLTVVPIKAETQVNFEGTRARKVLHTRIAKARIFDKATGQLLMEKDFGPAVAQAAIAHEVVPEGTPDFDGLDPYTIDFRGIKLGMTEAQMRAAAKAYFREVRTSPKFAPGYMKLFAEGGENLGVTFCTDAKICSMAYGRRWQEPVVSDVYDATVEKYGEPVGGRKPYDPSGRSTAREASMTWTRNYRRVGGVEGRISLVGKTTYLKMNAVDKTKTRKTRAKKKISLD